MTTDALSELLRTVRLTGAAFFDVAATEPWAVEQPPPQIMLPKILPGGERLISYHVVLEGRCFATLAGRAPIALGAGEVIVVTTGESHVLSSAPGLRASPVSREAIEGISAGPLPFFAKYGGNGAPTARLVCGFLACDARPFNPLLDHLPKVMTTRAVQGDRESWLEEFIRAAVAESAGGGSGSDGVLSRLSELMFIEVVRRHLQSMAPERTGWLAGLRDPVVGRALALMHGDPGHAWTIEELGRKAGLSRSMLAARFTALVQLPPMQYLARCRMQAATRILRDTDASVASVGERVGYGSEAAFSRAFKKLVGVSPSRWRSNT